MHQPIPASSSSPPLQEGNAKKITIIAVVIGAVLFLVSMTGPKTPLNANLLQPGDGNFIHQQQQTSDAGNNNPSSQKKSSSQKSDVSDDDSNLWWARGTGGRIVPSSLGTQKNTKCSIRPQNFIDSSVLGGWSVQCDFSCDNNNDNEVQIGRGKTGGDDILSFDIEFAQPIDSVSDTKCVASLKSPFAINTLSSSAGSSTSHQKCKNQKASKKDPKTVSISIPSISKIISDSSKQSVCSANKNKKIALVIDIDLKLSSPASDDWQTCFASIGDWGTYKKDAIDTAALLESVIKSRPDIRFIVSTGDNFYPTGVKGVNDPQFKNTFERLYSGEYTKPLLWILSAGNHDQWGLPGELEYGKVKSDRWYFPSRSFSVQFPLVLGDENANANNAKSQQHHGQIFILDTYGPQVDKQLAALVNSYAASSSATRWNVVIGHQPVYGGSAHGLEPRQLNQQKQYLTALKKSRTHMYLNGDDHMLEVHRVTYNSNSDNVNAAVGSTTMNSNDNNNNNNQRAIDFFTTGAGGGSSPYGAKVLDTTLLSYPNSVGFNVHCVSRKNIINKVARTEFYIVEGSRKIVQGKNAKNEEANAKVPYVDTPLG